MESPSRTNLVMVFNTVMRSNKDEREEENAPLSKGGTTGRELGFDSQNHINQIQWYTPVIRPRFQMEAGEPEVQGHSRFKANLSDMRTHL